MSRLSTEGQSPEERQLREELLAVCWRYSQESDVTISQTVRALHIVVETIVFAAGNKPK